MASINAHPGPVVQVSGSVCPVSWFHGVRCSAPGVRLHPIRQHDLLLLVIVLRVIVKNDSYKGPVSWGRWCPGSCIPVLYVNKYNYCLHYDCLCVIVFVCRFV